MNVHQSLSVKEISANRENSLPVTSIIVAECQCCLGNLCKWLIQYSEILCDLTPVVYELQVVLFDLKYKVYYKILNV